MYDAYNDEIDAAKLNILSKYKVRVPNSLQDTRWNLNRERQFARVHDLYRGFNCKRGLEMIWEMTIFKILQTFFLAF